ncbi:hypothetical protein [Flavobacterium chungbukense]|uniref:Uncharacterized protein n=1 Tax=Flavobacterium chungbukense TaxID=877464 RepID=A0ABP7YNP1_9FLAO|nr:hypothetical protein [Flavobacterium chungbukense]MCC4919815.1 hypothetical protein [Flavobacterium chungbukense]
MYNNTLEDLYKKAVKEKYEEAKNGDDFFFLNAPTRGKLNKLCWEKFTNNNMHSNDLNVFNSLLGISFDINSQKKFKKETNPFRPIENFFKGETDPDKIEVVDMAAILVDFQPRPFNKFRKQIDDEDLEIYNELKNNTKPNVEIDLGNLIDEVEEEFTDSEIDIDNKEPDQIQSEELESVQGEELKKTRTAISTFVKMDNKPKSNKLKYLAIGAVLFGLGLIIYLTLSQKDCIQWSGDHYEEVSCDLKIQGIGTFNSPEPYDERIINLRRIKVCDTSTFFKNEKAVVWYAKVGEKVEFFNTHGNHPENGKALKPVTKYIIDKYVRK